MAHLPTRFSPAVAKKLGFYVYLYVNPIDGAVFYVGKGRGNRVFAHLRASPDKNIAKTLKEIKAAKRQPRIEILAHGLTEKAAFRVEAAAIDLLGLGHLDNAVRGHGCSRLPVEDVIAHHTRRPAKIREPAILIRINRAYRYGMTDQELYDATRSAWRIGTRGDKAKLAMAVYDNVVREVYEITGWFREGRTFNARRRPDHKPADDRWEFVGVIANEKIRKRYRNRFVGEHFPKGAQNPIRYVNVD